MTIGQVKEYDNSKQIGVFTDTPFGFISLTVEKDQLLEQNPDLQDSDIKFATGGVAKNGNTYLKSFIGGKFIGNYFMASGVTTENVKAARVAGKLSFAIHSAGRAATEAEVAEMF